MKDLAQRAVALLVFFAAFGACLCAWPRPAYAAEGYTASNVASGTLLQDLSYLEFTWSPTAFEASDFSVSGGKVVALSGLPASERDGLGDDNASRFQSDDSSIHTLRPPSWNEKYCWIVPVLWANPGKQSMATIPYPGDKGDAWAFVSTSNSANNGAAGASFTVTWKKAALLRTGSDESNSSGRLVDIRMKTTFANTSWNPDATGTSNGKAVFQFTNDIAQGFFVIGPSVWDQEFTFLDSQTGNEIAIQGRLGIVSNSLNEGEGFSVKGADRGYVSSDAPHLSHSIGTPSAGLPAELQASAVPGSYVYELAEDDALGYMGVPSLNDGLLRRLTGNSGDSIEFVDNRFDSAKQPVLNGNKLAASASSYQWRSGGVSKDMAGSGTVAVRQYSIAYTGWPNAAATVPSGVPSNIGAATSNKANPYLDRNSAVKNPGSNASIRYYNMDFGAIYGTMAPAPVKHVQNHDALEIGDTVSFTIDQQVNSYPDNIGMPYTSFEIGDVLPSDLSYLGSKISYIAPGSTSEVAVPASAYSFSNSSGRHPCYAFKTGYLNSTNMAANTNPANAMVYRGGTYRLTVTAKVAAANSLPGERVNTGYSTINGQEREAQAPYLIDRASIDVYKDVKFEHEVGDEAVYTITLKNGLLSQHAARNISYDELCGGSNAPSGAQHVARNVMLSDTSLPANMEIVAGSLTVSGVPDKVRVAKVEKDRIVAEERQNSSSTSFDGNTLNARIAYLPYGAEVRYSFKVKCSEAFNGKEVFNEAHASLGNGVPVVEKDGDALWVNSADLSLIKRADSFEYRVGEIATYTLSLCNTIPGTIAKNVVVSDSAMDSRVKVDPNSIQVEGIPPSVAYNTDYKVKAEADMLDPVYGKHADEQRENKPILKKEGNGFSLVIPYLPYGNLVTVCYSATCTQNSNGLETMNTATAKLDNPLPGKTKPIESQDGIWTNDAVLQLSKEVDEYETQVNDLVSYSIRFQNIASGTVAKQLVLEDTDLPKGFVLDADSVNVEGIPDRIAYNEDANGTHKKEERTNTYTLDTSTNGILLAIDYLPAGVPVLISYKARPTEEINGDEVENTARLRAENVLDDIHYEDTALVWVNTPHLSLEKSVAENQMEYAPGDIVTYALRIANTAPGTIARKVHIDDAFRQNGMQLLRSSIYLFDAEGKILPDVKVVQNKNDANFSLDTNADLVCPDAAFGIWQNAQRTEGQSWNPAEQRAQTELHIEYQAAVSSSQLAGAEVENDAMASADNAEEASAETSIRIAKATTSQTEPKQNPDPSLDPNPVPDPDPDPNPNPEPKTTSEIDLSTKPKTESMSQDKNQDKEEDSFLPSEQNGEPQKNLQETSDQDPREGLVPAPVPAPKLEQDPKRPQQSDPAATGESSENSPSPVMQPEPQVEQGAPSSSLPSTPTENVRRAMAKTGDYLQTHPIFAFLAIAGATALLAYRMQTHRRRQARKRSMR